MVVLKVEKPEAALCAGQDIARQASPGVAGCVWA